jgi:hypothetical protein
MEYRRVCSRLLADDNLSGLQLRIKVGILLILCSRLCVVNVSILAPGVTTLLLWSGSWNRRSAGYHIQHLARVDWTPSKLQASTLIVVLQV